MTPWSISLCRLNICGEFCLSILLIRIFMIHLLPSFVTQKFQMFYDRLTFTGRGPAQVTRNESDVQPEPSQLCHWIGHVLPTPHAIKTAHLLVSERQQQQQRDGTKTVAVFHGQNRPHDQEETELKSPARDRTNFAWCLTTNSSC